MSNSNAYKYMYDFLETCPEEVNNNQWSRVYEKSPASNSNNQYILTDILYDAGINPIPYFVDKIPEYFYSHYEQRWSETGIYLPVKEFKFTNNIKRIGRDAFYDCKGCKFIFSHPDTDIEINAFNQCKNIIIEYPDTLENFEKHILYYLIKGVSPYKGGKLFRQCFLRATGIIQCIDDDYEIGALTNY